MNSAVHAALLAAGAEVAGRTDIRAVVLCRGEGLFAPPGADMKEKWPWTERHPRMGEDPLTLRRAAVAVAM